MSIDTLIAGGLAVTIVNFVLLDAKRYEWALAVTALFAVVVLGLGYSGMLHAGKTLPELLP